MPLKKIGALWKGKEGSKALLSGELQLEGKDGPKLRVLVFKNEPPPGKEAHPKAPHYQICLAEDDVEREPF